MGKYQKISYSLLLFLFFLSSSFPSSSSEKPIRRSSLKKQIPEIQKISNIQSIPDFQNEMHEILEILRETDSSFTDPHGFLKLYPTEEGSPKLDNENPVLFTSELFFLLKKLGILKGELREHYKNKVKEMISLLRLEPGLFNRFPGREDSAFQRHFSRDEQIGLITLDYAFDRELGFSEELYQYGKKHAFVFQNRNWSSPGEHRKKVFNQQGEEIPKINLHWEAQRLPEFIEYVRLAAGHSPTLGGKVAFCEALKITQKRPPENTSGKIMAYLRFEVMQNQSSTTNKCIQEFNEYLVQTYGPNPFHQMLLIYFKHPRHPLKRLSEILSRIQML